MALEHFGAFGLRFWSYDRIFVFESFDEGLHVDRREFLVSSPLLLPLYISQSVPEGKESLIGAGLPCSCGP